MKPTSISKTVAAALVLTTVATVSAYAGANRKEIKAYLDYDVKLQYNVEEKTMLDANGSRVYPIFYNGEIYLPVSQFENLMDVPAKYDTAKNTVRLGITGDAVDFIDTYKPVYISNGGTANQHVMSGKGKTLEIGSQKYTHYIQFYPGKAKYNETYHTYLSYDIGKKYTTLQFDIHSKANRDDSISVLGDDDKLLCKIDMKQGDILQTVKIDVTGVSQIKFVSTADTVSNAHYVYIVNGILQ